MSFTNFFLVFPWARGECCSPPHCWSNRSPYVIDHVTSSITYVIDHLRHRSPCVIDHLCQWSPWIIDHFMTQITLGDYPWVMKLTGDASHGINSSMGNILTNPPIITSVAQEYGTHDLSPTLTPIHGPWPCQLLPLLTWITCANKKPSSHSSHDTNPLSNTQPIRKDHSPDPRPLIFCILDILDHKVEKITGLVPVSAI